MVVDSSDYTLVPIEQKVRIKLEKYDSFLCIELLKLAQFLDPRFGSDLLTYSAT